MNRRLPILTGSVAALILVAVLLPGSSLPEGPGIPGFDKLVHFCLFAALAVAAHLDFCIEGRRLAWALAAAVAFSALTEALQLLVDGRASELLDMVADMAGFAFGLLVRRPSAAVVRAVAVRLLR